MKDWLLIGEFSKVTGLSLKALRIYEEKKLLVPHERGENKYRYFSTQQIEQADKISQFKEMGFSLDQIKLLLEQTSTRRLTDIIADKIGESRRESILLAAKIQKLEKLLSSLKQNQPLTDEQKGEIMENLYEYSLNNLKRQGIQSDQVESLLKTEIEHLSPKIKELLPEIKNLLKVVEQNDILIGPGRANTLASLILLGEKYSPLNPVDFGLMPETFAHSKIFMLDVEYSNSQLIGQLCDEVSKKINFEVVAFKSPILDILKDVQNQVGRIDFESFNNFDPRILGASKLYGRKGLFGPDWNPNFEAFRRAPKWFQEEFCYNAEQLDEVYGEYEFKSPMDYINTQTLLHSFGIEELKKYRKETNGSGHPELDYTNGLLIYREDWLRIYMRLTGARFEEISPMLTSMREYPEKHSIRDLGKIEDPELRRVFFDSIPTLFSKSHGVSWWWYYKRTAILKALWSEIYLDAIKRWEDKHQMIWREFGYKDTNYYHLKA